MILLGSLVVMKCIGLVFSSVVVLGNVVISFLVCRWVMFGILVFISIWVKFRLLCSLVDGLCVLVMCILLIVIRVLMVFWLLFCLKKCLSDCVILLLMFGICLNSGYGSWWISVRLLN